MKHVNLYFYITVMVASGARAEGLGDIPDVSGFSGSVLVGASIGESKSNFSTGNDKEKRIDSLGSAWQHRSIEPVFNADVRYTFASTRSQLFLGNLIQDAIRGDGTQQFGLRQQLGDKGIVAGSMVFNATPVKVWSDPFAVGTERQESVVNSHGARLAWDNIWGSSFNGSVTTRNVKVDEELSGVQYGSNAMGMLDRNGRLNTLELSYRFQLSGTQSFEPALRWQKADLNGRAESYVSKGLQISYATVSPQWSFVSNFYLGRRNYEEANPLFGQRADSNDMAVDASFFWFNMWGIPPLSTVLNASYTKSNSDIDFYDISSSNITLGLLYRF